MKKILTLFFSGSFVLISCLLLYGSATVPESLVLSSEHNPDKIYQLRTYTTHEGKLDDLHERFENHTMDFFEKHGMTNIGYWVPDDPELRDNTLIYILAHDSREAAEASWEAFRADPGWQEVYEASRADGPIVKDIESVYIHHTAYSPMQ